MTLRPHLVLDGALLAADAVGAEEVDPVRGRGACRRAIVARGGAVAARARSRPCPTRSSWRPTATSPARRSAAVHFVNDGDARPTTTPPRPFESGVGGRPTLVQNVESIAYVALIARAAATGIAPRPAADPRDRPRDGERRLPARASARSSWAPPLGEVATMAGTERVPPRPSCSAATSARGRRPRRLWNIPLDPIGMRNVGRSFGAGIVSFLPAGTCGMAATARIMDYMAGSSAAQCGPCVFGLRAIADATDRLARGKGTSDDLARVERWTGQLAGRGACRHPDGAVGLLASALRVFGSEFVRHAAGRGCSMAGGRGAAA